MSQYDYWSQQIFLFYIIKIWGMVFQTHSIGCMIHWSPIIPPSWLFLCFIFIKSLSTMILLSDENCASRTLIRYERKIWCEIYESELKSGGSGKKGTWDGREKKMRQLFSCWPNPKKYISLWWLGNIRLPSSTICICLSWNPWKMQI